MDPGDLDDVVVLLVDDDVDWLELTSSLLERADESLSIRTASGGWEALDVLENERIDCVVCDYRMPDMDGIAVLERVRAKGMELPFIIVTSEGDESVASRAISSQVTDYFVKDIERDQSSNLAARIRSAVASHRTRKELAAVRRQFTGLFENVPDPVAVVDPEGGIQRTNDAFERTFDVREDRVQGGSIGDCVGGDLGDGADGDGAMRNLSLSTADGLKEFLVRRFRLNPDRPAVGYVFTDVTEQHERQRDLQRALALDAEVRELLLSASTRDDLERSFCEAVVEPEGRVLAAVAEPGPGGSLRVRSAAGDLFDAAEEMVGDDDAPPAIALTDGNPQYVPETEGLEDAWAETALEAGVHSAFAVPIDRDGVTDGVFAVYDGRPGAFDGDDRDRLADLVSSLGAAVGLVERMGALSADRVLRVRLTVEGDGPLSRTATALDSPVELAAVTRTGEGTEMYVDVVDAEGGADRARRRLAEQAPFDAVETVLDEGTTRFHVEASGVTLPGLAIERGGSVDTLRVTDAGEYRATVDVPPSADIEPVVDAVERHFDGVTVRSIKNQERDADADPVRTPLSALTERQRESLEAAYYEGYFERPRKNSSEAIAETLDISSSTFLEHLRESQQKLLTAVLQGSDPGPGEGRSE